ncbi:MAG: hypothetical protein K0R63_1567 [Rickettsiales bacterium]|jgi:hypothetical protein|nr:hypothetical protein [Rickettsiales bacterium]
MFPILVDKLHLSLGITGTNDGIFQEKTNHRSYQSAA